MTDISLKLSAYLDGELGPTEHADIETLLENDPDVQRAFEAFMDAEAQAMSDFDAQLTLPVPLELIRQIKDTPLAPKPTAKRPTARPIWGLLAASLVMLVLGGTGGFFLGMRSPEPTTGWLGEIADYHAIYSEQERHLVEVNASEPEHITAWLGKTLGMPVSIPDLSAFDLTFVGGRLLVARAQPVAQLMYRLPDGTVVALCFKRGGEATGDARSFETQSINGFDLVSWSTNGGDYVVIGPNDLPNLAEIATQASTSL